MSIELRHLRAFVAVAEELNFTRAADRLHLAQQALSTQIRQLEDRVGEQLLQRTTRKVELTAAGEAMLEHARAVLGGADRAVAAARAAGRAPRPSRWVLWCPPTTSRCGPRWRSSASGTPRSSSK